MARFVIEGGRPLHGTIDVEANKNAVLPMMAACLLTDDDCLLDNVPRIADVATMTAILQELGATVEQLDAHSLRINCRDLSRATPPAHLVERLRASIVLMGPLLARFGRAAMPHPGGDAIGTRSIDTHIGALTALGAQFSTSEDVYEARLGSTSDDCYIFLDEASVTATENAMLLASAQARTTTIRNAASEPHIENLAALLVKMGACIEGAGSNVLRIRGADRLHGARDRVWPDHIEAGTFAALAAACKSEITINNVVPGHLEMPLLILEKMGLRYTLDGCRMCVFPSELRAAKKIQTGIWPAFPTDLASIFIVLATQASGMTLVHDWMYEGRMFFVDRLVQMGAKIVLADPHRAVVSGPSELRGREFPTPDIRAGIALVMAGLIARGRSEIEHAEVIDRGYERIDERLRSLGANITRVT